MESWSNLLVSCVLAKPVGVFTLWQSLSSFTKTDECHVQSGGDVLLPTDFALERATKRASGFLDSNDLIYGLMMI